MRIVYDLRYASDHFPGIGTHAHELLRALLDQPGEERWIVLGPGTEGGRFDFAPIRAHARVEWRDFDAPALAPDTGSRTGAKLRELAADVYFSPFWLMPANPRMPVVLTLHDVLPLANLGGFAWWRRLLFRTAVDRAAAAAAVLTSSEFSRREIARLTRIPAARVHAIPLGVPAPPAVTAAPRISVDRPFALVVGTNKPHKNLGVLIQAWRCLGDAPPLDLVRAGHSDPRFPDLATLAAGLPHVTALGRVSAAELEWLYAHATVVVFPTRYEGFGFPLLEAMSRGVPVIASDLPVLREVGESAACFVPAEEPAAWAEAVRALAGDAAERARRAALGRTIAAGYGYARCAESTLGVLRGVASAKAA